VIISSVVRAIRIDHILHATDTTWQAYDTSIWSAVEINVSLICAVTPALKQLSKHFAPGLLFSASGGTNERSTWVKAGRKGTGGFALSHIWVTHRDLTSHSQKGLAQSVGQNSWVMGKLDSTVPPRQEDYWASDEIQGDGIMKKSFVMVISQQQRDKSRMYGII